MIARLHPGAELDWADRMPGANAKANRPIVAASRMAALVSRSNIWPLGQAHLADVATRPWPRHMEYREYRAYRRQHRAWPERAALATAIVIAIVSALIAIVTLVAVGTAAYLRLNITLLGWASMAELTIVPTVWSVLRVIAFIGNWREERRARKRRVEPQFKAGTAIVPGE